MSKRFRRRYNRKNVVNIRDSYVTGDYMAKEYAWKKEKRQCRSLVSMAKQAGINDAQIKQLDTACGSSFNQFNGPKVVKSLIKNRGLWKGAIMKRPAFCSNGKNKGDLIDLRDLPDGYSNIDTLFITPEDGKAEQLKKLVKKEWDAQEVDILLSEEASDRLGTPLQKILRVWWD